MQNYENYTEKQPITLKSMALSLARKSFTELSFFQIHTPFVLVSFGFMMWFYAISFESEYQFIFQFMKSKYPTLLLCGIVEVAKFFLWGLTWSSKKLGQQNRFLGFLLFAILLSASSFLMSFYGTDKVALLEKGEKPQNTVAQDNEKYYSKSLTDVAADISEQKAIIKKNKHYKKHGNSDGLWVRRSSEKKLFDGATAKLEVYQNLKMKLETQKLNQLETGQAEYAKSSENYTESLANFGEFLRYKVALTELLNNVLSYYVWAFFLWTLLTNGKGLQGYAEMLEREFETAQIKALKGTNSPKNSSTPLQERNETETEEIEAIKDFEETEPLTERIKTPYKGIPQATEEKEVQKFSEVLRTPAETEEIEAIKDFEETEPLAERIKIPYKDIPQVNEEKEFSEVLRTPTKNYKILLSALMEQQPTISKAELIGLTNITKGFFTEIMQDFLMDKAKAENLPVHNYRERNKLLKAFYLMSSFKELDNLIKLKQEQEKNAEIKDLTASEPLAERIKTSYKGIPQANHEIGQQIELSVLPKNGKPINGVQKEMF